LRDDLNQRAPRVLCVLRPLRVVLTNWPEGKTEEIDAPYWPHDVPRHGSRPLPFSRELFIERDDFMEDPPAGYHRLAPGREVRLRYGYVIRCDEVIRDESGAVVELRCSYDPETRSGKTQGRAVRGTIHWVSAEHSVPCEVRLYDRLFRVAEPEVTGDDWKAGLNPESLVVIPGARIEPSVADDPADTHYQFERLGYFRRDPVDSRNGALVFNRTVTLRDTWERQDSAGSEVDVQPAARPEPAVDRERKAGKAGATAVDPERSASLQARRARYISGLGVGETEGEIITRDEQTADLFEAAVSAGAPARAVANWIVHEIPREVGGRGIGDLPFGGAELGR